MSLPVSPNVLDHRAFITELSGKLFQRLNIPRILCKFEERSAGPFDPKGYYSSTNNDITFFDAHLTGAGERYLTWITWHEILHYYHELQLRQYKHFYYVSNIGDFKFPEGEDHRNIIENIFNDFQDWIVDQQIFSLEKIIPEHSDRIKEYDEALTSFNESRITLQQLERGVMQRFIKIASILKFNNFPKESSTYCLSNYLPTDVSRQAILSSLDQLSFQYPNKNPELICKIFGMITPYTLAFGQQRISELTNAEKELSFWIKDDSVCKVRTFFLHKK